jgi:BirA family transcriptional regulator, biotin operon repressor / biotin---[acetyl-CoA-carboxylase] ligase
MCPREASGDLDPGRLLAETWVDRVEYQQTLTSTNDRARQLAAEVSPDQIVLVAAEEQTAGRGRGANRWWTGSGSLAFSVLLVPARWAIERRYQAMMPLAAAVAIVETAAPLVPAEEVGVHWPNDVFVGPRKLAGILVEVLPDGRQIVGIGLNVNNSAAAAPAEIAARVTTLADASGRTWDRTGLLVELLRRFADNVEQLGRSPAELGRRANELCLQRGGWLCLEGGGRQVRGRCAGIADDGALLLETPAGREAFYSGVLVKDTA